MTNDIETSRAGDFLADWSSWARRAVEQARRMNAAESRHTIVIDGYEVECVVRERPRPEAERCSACHGRGVPCVVCKTAGDSEGRCAVCQGRKYVERGEEV